MAKPKFDKETRQAQLYRIVDMRNSLTRTTDLAITELIGDVMGKTRTLKIFDTDDATNEAIVFLDPSNDNTSRTCIKSILLGKGGKITIVPFDPDGNDEREEIDLVDLSVDAKINLFQFLIDK